MGDWQRAEDSRQRTEGRYCWFSLSFDGEEIFGGGGSFRSGMQSPTGARGGGRRQAELGRTHSQAELGNDRKAGRLSFRSPFPLSSGDSGHFHSANESWQCRSHARTE